MVVMHFDTNATLAAVKRPRRSQELARVAIAQLVLLLLRLNVTCAIINVGIEKLGQVFELSQVIKLVDSVSSTHLFKLLIKLIFIQVLSIVLADIACFLLFLVWNS